MYVFLFFMQTCISVLTEKKAVSRSDSLLSSVKVTLCRRTKQGAGLALAVSCLVRNSCWSCVYP